MAAGATRAGRLLAPRRQAPRPGRALRPPRAPRACRPAAVRLRSRSGSSRLWTRSWPREHGYPSRRGASHIRRRRDCAATVPGRRIACVAPRPPLRRRIPGRGDRASPRAARAGRPVRDRPTPRRDALPARRGARRHRVRGRRRRAAQRATAAGRLPRPQPFLDLGVQVCAARGGGEAAQARLAGPRDPARAGDVEPLRQCEPRAGRSGRAVRAARGRPRRHRERAHGRTSDACSSRSRSTASRSTSSPTGSARRGVPSTRPFTTRGASFAPTSTSAASRSSPTWRRADGTT